MGICAAVPGGTGEVDGQGGGERRIRALRAGRMVGGQRRFRALPAGRAVSGICVVVRADVSEADRPGDMSGGAGLGRRSGWAGRPRWSRGFGRAEGEGGWRCTWRWPLGLRVPGDGVAEIEMSAWRARQGRGHRAGSCRAAPAMGSGSTDDLVLRRNLLPPTLPMAHKGHRRAAHLAHLCPGHPRHRPEPPPPLPVSRPSRAARPAFPGRPACARARGGLEPRA